MPCLDRWRSLVDGRSWARRGGENLSLLSHHRHEARVRRHMHDDGTACHVHHINISYYFIHSPGLMMPVVYTIG